MVDALGGKKVFLRRSSGLIKSASTWDVFIFNVGLVSVGIGVANMLLYTSYIYPGSNVGWSSLIGGLCMLLVGLGMVAWTITIPRSGGIYVFGTRILWPPIAFALSFVEVGAWLYYTSLGSSWIMSIGIGPGLATLGILQNSPGLLAAGETAAKPLWVFLGGTIFLCLSGWLIISGMKKYFLSQKIIFSIAVLGSVILAILLLFYKQSDFIQNFNSVMAPYFPGVTNAYQNIIDTAKSAGWVAGTGSIDWWQTFLFASWPFMAYIGAAFSISIGGEIRSGGRGQFIGIIAAIIASTLAFIIMGMLAVRVFGSDFLGAVSYNFYNAVEGGAVPSAPWVTLLIAILVRNPFLALFINLSFIAWIWLWIPGMQIYADRAFVAWSFDRLAPDRLGKVSERTHTPINAITLAVIGTIILLALYVFTPYFTTVIMIEAAALAWFVVLCAGVFFPYRKKSLYEKSPLAHNRILGLPAQTVACFLGALGAGVAFIFMWSDNFAAGHSRYSLAVMGAWILLGLIIYAIMYFYRKSKGIDVNECFKEIPCE